MKQFCLIALLGALPLAHAGEYLYQPPTGTTAVTAQAGYRQMQSRREKSDGSDPLTAKGLYKAGVKADYGLNSKASVGAALTYTDLEVKSDGTNHYSGIEPLNLYVRAQEPMPPATLLYGLDLRVGVEKSKANGRGDANRTAGDVIDGFSETLSVTPYVGAATLLGPGRLGVTFAYDIYKMNSKFEVVAIEPRDLRVDTTLERGNRSVLTGFYEVQLERVLLGVDLAWIRQMELKIKALGDSAAFPGYGFMRAELYANVAVGQTGSFIPTLTAHTTMLSDLSEDTDDLRLVLAYRQTF